MEQFGRYWIVAILCFVVALAMLRLLLRERLTLQSSLSYLAFLAVMGAVALFPNATRWVATQLGFTLPSNFFFATAIGALALLHLSSQITLSRVELRSIALTQELGVLREMVERAIASGHLEGGASKRKDSSGR